MKKNLWDSIAPIVKPSYWMMLNPYSPRWDAKLTQLLTENKFTDAGEYTARLGDFLVWVANHPYGNFHPWDMEGLPQKIRARRSTIHYAERRLRKDLRRDGDPYPEESKEVSDLRKMWNAQ